MIGLHAAAALMARLFGLPFLFAPMGLFALRVSVLLPLVLTANTGKIAVCLVLARLDLVLLGLIVALIVHKHLLLLSRIVLCGACYLVGASTEQSLVSNKGDLATIVTALSYGTKKPRPVKGKACAMVSGSSARPRLPWMLL